MRLCHLKSGKSCMKANVNLEHEEGWRTSEGMVLIRCYDLGYWRRSAWLGWQSDLLEEYI